MRTTFLSIFCKFYGHKTVQGSIKVFATFIHLKKLSAMILSFLEWFDSKMKSYSITTWLICDTYLKTIIPSRPFFIITIISNSKDWLLIKIIVCNDNFKLIIFIILTSYWFLNYNRISNSFTLYLCSFQELVDYIQT